MSLRLDGRNPLAYMGVNPNQPPQMLVLKRAPTTTDTMNVNLGTLWLVPEQDSGASLELYVLMSLADGVATWVQLYPGSGGGGTSNFITDSGTAVETGGDITIHGGSNIGTTGAGSTVTVNLDNTISVSGSITAGTTLNSTGDTIVGDDLTVTDDVTISSFGAGVVQSDGSGMLSSTNGSNGQLLIGGGSAPVWANLTSTGGTITITPGPNSINLEAVGEGGGGGSSFIFVAGKTADGDTSLDFTSGITETYKDYLIVLDQIQPTVANKDFIVQLSVDGGSNWITTGYINSSGTQTTGISLANLGSTTIPATTSFTSGVSFLHNVTTAAGYVQNSNTTISIFNPVGSAVNQSGGVGAYATPNQLVDALRFKYSDGSAFDGTINIYGMATTPIPFTGGGSLVFIQEQTANSDTSLDFTMGITSSYNDYFVILEKINPSVAGKNFMCQFSTDGGMTWITADYSNSVGALITSGMVLMGTLSVSDPSTDSFGSCTSNIFNLTSGSGFIQAASGINATYYNSNTGVISNTGGNGAYEVAGTQVDALRFLYEDGSAFDGTVKLFAYSDNSGGGGSDNIKITTFNSSATWTKDARTTAVSVLVCSAGSGGGSGRRGSSTASSGGGGGAPGAYVNGLTGGGGVNPIPASLFNDTETVTVGAGGAGGAAQTVNDTNGNNGGDGGGSGLGYVGYPASTAGGGGGGNTTSGNGVGGSGNGSNTTGANGSGQGASGGGSGADSGTARQAGNGVDITSWDTTVLATAGLGGIETGTIDGGDGGDQDTDPMVAHGALFKGAGGGGGGGQKSGMVAGIGGNGGFPGGPGAGGGGSLNGTNSGAGGSGADGQVIVIEYF